MTKRGALSPARVIDKAAAITIDAKYRHLAKEELAAIGDSIADLSMASAVSMFFLIDNDDNQARMNSGQYENILVTDESMGLGWAEAAKYITDQL